MPKEGPFNSCLICASTNLREIAGNRNFGINIIQCNACNFVQSEYVSDRGLESYYKHFYRGKLDAQAMVGQREKGLAQARSQIAYLLEQRPGLKISAALDYGTAEGSLGHELGAIADKVWVTEMDPQFVALLKTDPLVTLIEHKELESGKFESFFDLVCISHVLEHLTDPYQAMDLFTSVLKPGGLLLVDIPNEVRLLQRGFQAAGHLIYFTKESFGQFVGVHGCFDLIEIRTCNREVDLFIESGFTAPERYDIPLARDGTVVRALLQNRAAEARRKLRRHTFDESALLNEYSARLLHYHKLLEAIRGRMAQLEKELQVPYQARRRAEITKALFESQHGNVLSGPFAGMAMLPEASWGDGDLAPKLLGCYEAELHPAIAKAIGRAPKTVINVGCAEGYYAVGMARALPQSRIFAFDTSDRAQAICSRAAALNQVDARAKVGGTCTFDTLRNVISNGDRSLLFVDCEGGELQLLDPAEVPSIAACDVIVECHDFINPSITSTLYERFAKSHDIEVVSEGPRDPNQFPTLKRWGSSDRWLAVNENRPVTMNWLVCWAR
ncbi:MAG TPA: methyltransferase domain-containing protein [Xanthobacteraceae bacterium]|nr:methyltransferase domain-containing protein [Xanthobacteraceae bacterium]